MTAKHLVEVLCAYELVALHSPLPTLSSLAHAHRDSWLCRAALAVGLGWLTWHLCFEEA